MSCTEVMEALKCFINEELLPLPASPVFWSKYTYKANCNAIYHIDPNLYFDENYFFVYIILHIYINTDFVYD